MKAADYVSQDACALAGLVRSGEVSALERAEAAIERSEALNGSLNAVVEKAYDVARQAAGQSGVDRPLAGVPFLAKDLDTDVAGLHLTASCRWLAKLPPAQHDAPLATAWRAAGLTILGRTNTPEWAEDFVTEPTWRGPTSNPWDLRRSPGGSSGGAAAAVASGMVPVAHATDSGGSIRVPASACGLVGLKPSRGLTPVGPHLDELSGGFDVGHVLTRTVRDCAQMLDVTAQPDAVARYPYAPRAQSYLSALDEPLPRLRIGVCVRAPGDVDAQPDVAAATESIARVLARAGHEIVPFAFPPETDIGTPAALIWMTAIAEEIDHLVERVGRPPRPDELEAATRECLRLGAASSAVDYVRARRACTLATRRLVESMSGLDLILTPTTASVPPLTGTIDGRTDGCDVAQWAQATYRYAPFTEIFNVSGQPAISLPLCQSEAGLPIGVQFAARLGEDRRLLTLAGWFERELPWAARTTALALAYL